MSREMALAAYRHILRGAALAFREDAVMLNAARTQVRHNFESNRNLKPGSEEFTKSIEHAEGVAQILRENVVQGRKGEDGRYKLGIHEHTERGDNDSIKIPRSTNLGGKCCSS